MTAPEPVGYDRVVYVQGHPHSEPICVYPQCETYLTPAQMDATKEAK